ncbi:DNA replication/repair protein RecF [Alteromonas sp. McT4-15]|jgi:DNA replication and repair protein RecF|uniref:DNA replication/repair protein RecF n=1 Tax=unclassified Alteromonas TaxID=2614992 RepID=UPI0019226758|nr:MULTISPECIES: DNA replication/repair protein RecF [unclassified Alteromonas]MCB4437273.1 DNA replication/repair protein RecF [Alteromonas sp. McT4-15]WDT86165.1 DNA replication/repair protein RecF [Alteromonas sp. 009811495]BCO17145.1 DNA replication and repair protein RecF [Alteromonas sp. KC3]BCO21134.1 DNA replication and repair protein RecF [Alteromonas sp. KC14]
MKLDRIQITQFRNLSSITFSPSPTLTVIRGVNGSGKSSLIEALYYLGFGRSFRTNKHGSVIQHEKDSFSVFASCLTDEGDTLKLGFQRSRADTFTCSINGEHSTKLADLVSLVPIQLFTPQSTDLIIGSPAERRRFCDWGLFHVKHHFPSLANQYGKFLKHRNALLKQQANLAAPENQYWESQFAELGESMTAFRQDYVSSLTPIFKEYAKEFLPTFEVELSYYKGWEKDVSLSESLVKKREYDGKIGHTSSGPHKADLRLKVNGVNAQELLSRGQLRMAVAALQMSQTRLYNSATHHKSIFLLDDVGAELDADKREQFIDGLLEMDTQVFVTAIESTQLEFIQKYNEKKMFHVEHGNVKEE